MLTYQAPLRDIEFVLGEWLGVYGDWALIPQFESLDAETVEVVLRQAASFATHVVLPINLPGDKEGCHFEHGAVRTPAGYQDAYRAFVKAGWPAISCSAEDGGTGLPFLLNAILYEMLNAACHAWTMYPGLAHGAYECLRHHGSDELKRIYLPKIVSGEWLATMCLTEAQAGSDLGLLRTYAVKDTTSNSHAYKITGAKIFISGGAQDLSDNIIHLVLARVANSPAGSKGLSLFLVPQKIPDRDVLLENAVRCDRIEQKMGIKGSATCSLLFEEASGWLIGDVNRGLPAMFVMMNAARLHVALQGLGLAEVGHQNAVAYAKVRLQMRAPGWRSGPLAADPIEKHPAIQRSLMEQRSIIEGERALAYWIAHIIDMGEHHPSVERRRECIAMAALLTPVAKALFTEFGFSLTSSALQIFGGYGYIHDTGIEQLVRDSRVGMIYEGTNEVQANDLLVRKVIADNGISLELLLTCISSLMVGNHMGAHIGRRRRIAAAADAFRTISHSLIAASAIDSGLAYRVAGKYLRSLGLLMLGHVWHRALLLAFDRERDGEFYKEKVQTAIFYLDFMMPELDHLIRLIEIDCALVNKTFDFHG